MDQPIQAHLPNAELRAPPPQHVPTSRSTSETHFAPQHQHPSNATTRSSDAYQPHRKLVIPWWKPWEKLQTPAVPDPWILRKQVVGIVLGLSAWAFYVGVARVCAPAIREWPNAGFSRAAGIGTLVAFVILWLMFMWSYIVIITTPPGFASDVVQNNPDPEAMEPTSSLDSTLVPFVEHPPKAFEMSAMGSSNFAAQPLHPLDGPIVNLTPRPNAPPPHLAAPAPEGFIPYQPQPNPVNPQPPTSGSIGPKQVPRPIPPIPTGPRYCRHCNIIKPERTHHCRHCARCVLQFDHHCLWIGQCVGWRNHAVFLTFNFWAGLFCLYNTILLIVHTVKTPKIDPQQVALIAISGLLFIFTLGMLFPTHVTLILSGKSTIESFQDNGQRQRENAALAEHLGGTCNVRERRGVIKQWDAEWGGVNPTDRWVFGTKSQMWKREMGDKWIGWILPIGKPQGDGVHFEPNPRFGPNGEWLPKQYWPKVVAI